MKAARLHAFDAALELDEVPAPEITGPFDVIVRVGGPGSAAPTCTSCRAGSTT
jgi:NAD+-dependent secondary alcohol dehydrogenase Adh1